MKKLNERWSDIRSAARSPDPFDRTFALSAAVTCVEVGLSAVGIEKDPKREGVQSRLRRWEKQNGKSEFGDKKYHEAFEARNVASHSHVVAEPKVCQEHISALSDVWRALRRAYVTKETAATLAEAILDASVATDVFLFGSLVRRRTEPKDIDLLLFDRGDVSALNWGGYSSTDFVLEDELFGSFPDRRAASVCGWLDYVFVDGTRFGEDRAYTLSLCQSQRDPLFMINISDGLLKYDRVSAAWIDRRPQVFQRLANLRRLLETENIVGGFQRRRGRLTRR